MKKLNILLILFMIIILGSCSSSKVKFDHSVLPHNISYGQDTLSQIEIMKKHLTYADNKWTIHITKDEAVKLGVKKEIYEYIVESIITVNRDLDSLKKLNIKVDRAE